MTHHNLTKITILFIQNMQVPNSLRFLINPKTAQNMFSATKAEGGNPSLFSALVHRNLQLMFFHKQ